MFSEVQHIHLIGIGGIGMSALAKLFLLQGKQVTGSDLHIGEITRDLVARGAVIQKGHAVSNLPSQAEFVIHSPAVPDTNPEYQLAKELGLPVLSYAEALGELSKHYSTIVVTGTHGKSTTTAMIGLILEAAGYDPTVILGSFVPSFAHGNLRVGSGRFLVIEGCEHQANMLHLHPEMIVLTSIEADHLDFYRTLENIRIAFQTFVDRLSGMGLVIVNADDPVSQTLHIANPVRYGSDVQAHYHQRARTVAQGLQSVEIHRLVPKEALGTLSLQVPGAFNVSNALAAIAAAMELGIPFETCVRALGSFPGIWRRFERVGEVQGAPIISDYGHHPTAVRVTLQAARELFPNRRIILCFQPHQHARTEALFEDFVTALSEADALVLSEIYRVDGRTEQETISSQHLVDAISLKRPDLTVRFAPDFEEAQKGIMGLLDSQSVVIIQGAGTIDELARQMVR
ncbi:UDP-N-acetylmuramate--L-alanine ligase [Candidatus Uhrbacteria bacterium]|nr:UDP-N-acetylmuramate--L-alanine ligase [Candidatus Uhrbacteria bacterium]